MMCVLWGDDAGRRTRCSAVRRGGGTLSEVWWRDASDFPNINAQKSYLLDKNQPPRPRTHRTGAHSQLDHSQHLSALAPCRIPTRTPRTRTLKTHLKTLPSLLSRSTLANNGRITPQTHAAHRSKNSYNPREVHHENTNRLTRTLTCSPHRIHTNTRALFGRQRRKERPGYAALCVAMSLVPGCPLRGTAQRRRVSTSARGTYGGVCGRRRRCPQKRRHLCVECGGEWEVSRV